jgi:hypothetical protein
MLSKTEINISEPSTSKSKQNCDDKNFKEKMQKEEEKDDSDLDAESNFEPCSSSNDAIFIEKNISGSSIAEN